MKLRKLFLSAATGCLLVGASGAAMAQEEEPVVDTCEDGRIVATAVDEIRVDGISCFVSEVFVTGDVTATNSRTFTLTSSVVGGSVTVTGSVNTSILANEVYKGDIQVELNEHAIVSVNRVRKFADGVGGNILVNQHANAQVDRNIADGDITCEGNEDLDEFFNIAGGTKACP